MQYQHITLLYNYFLEDHINDHLLQTNCECVDKILESIINNHRSPNTKKSIFIKKSLEIVINFDSYVLSVIIKLAPTLEIRNKMFMQVSTLYKWHTLMDINLF